MSIVREPTVADAQSPASPPRILVLLGLKAAANRLIEIAATEEFAYFDVQQVDVSEAESPAYRWPKVDIVVTAGKSGCQLALQKVRDTRILCTLLTEENFLSLDTTHRDSNSPILSALVIDQPANRQMQVARRVYPSLAQFSLFSGIGAGVDKDSSAIDVFPFRKSVPLPAQLNDALSDHDALIATSDSEIYNASTLSTVLLTAYGYGKPVIGFSRTYVKAGALLTCYATPGQILRQIATLLTASPELIAPGGEVLYSDYFSIVDNPRVARSLGLIKEFPITTGKTYTDADFKP